MEDSSKNKVKTENDKKVITNIILASQINFLLISDGISSFHHTIQKNMNMSHSKN
jgi:hypothetical protein